MISSFAALHALGAPGAKQHAFLLMTQLTVLVEGWRFLPHSYALVSQHLCLEFLGLQDIRLYHRDLAPFRADWRRERGLLTPMQEARLAAIPPPPDGLVPDAVFRIGFPYDFSCMAGRRSFVQVTAELDLVPAQCVANGQSLASAHARSDAVIVTPSHYCRGGLIASGADPARIAIVPHGVDPEVFAPLAPSQRDALRAQLGWTDRFVFMNVGAMTENKGLDILLSAFAAVASREPKALLLLKGLDGLYQSGANIGTMLGRLGIADRAITSRIVYQGAAVDARTMACLYGAADAYVSPYLAEGFNIPVLEAIACGLPVICTAGGPTDEFTTTDLALRIRSVKGPSPWGIGRSLAPDLSHAAECMAHVMQDGSFRRRAALAGPAHVRAHFTWAAAAERMLALFEGGESPTPCSSH